MPGGVDRGHPGQPEVPHQVRVQERRDHRPGRAVDVDRDVRAAAGGQLVERRGDVGDRLVAAVEGRAEDRDDADRVLVAMRDRLGRAEVQPVALDGHQPRLDVPVAAELLPADLHVGAHDQVRLAGGVVAGPGRPPALQGHPGQHAGLARSGGGTTGRDVGFGRVPQVGEDRHAPVLDGRGLRVLVLVDHVLVDGLGHQLVGLRLHPGRDEGGQVQPGAAVEQQLVVHQLVGDVGRDGMLGQGAQRRTDLMLQAGLADPGTGCHARCSLRTGRDLATVKRHAPTMSVALPGRGCGTTLGVRSAAEGGGSHDLHYHPEGGREGLGSVSGMTPRPSWLPAIIGGKSQELARTSSIQPASACLRASIT